VTWLIEYEQPVHLIVVRRNHSGSQHRHPTMPIDGTRMVEMTLPTAGGRRVFADVAAETSQPGCNPPGKQDSMPQAELWAYLVEG
jgi:hypothetical protein